jgi:hypothetical protein
MIQFRELVRGDRSEISHLPVDADRCERLALLRSTNESGDVVAARDQLACQKGTHLSGHSDEGPRSVAAGCQAVRNEPVAVRMEPAPRASRRLAVSV